MSESLIIRGATVYDGSGGPGRTADVAVRYGRIEVVGRLPDRRSSRTYDATGLALAPGFIDLHSHADFTLPAFPGARNSISQGVTTEVVGNCGDSPAPLSRDPGLARLRRTEARGMGPDLAWDWGTMAEYLTRLDAARPAVNCVPLVGHASLRIAAMGLDDRPAREREVDAMREGLHAAMGAGAWGLSTGLVYRPGVAASTKEIVEVGEALRQTRGLYATHVRNEGDGVVGAVKEAIEIGRRSGARIQISHLKAAGTANLGLVRDALAEIERANLEGIRVNCDVYPYMAMGTYLSQLLPPWAEVGGADAIARRLRSTDIRARVAIDIRDGLPGWNNYVTAAGGWDRILVASVADERLRPMQGRSLKDLALESGADPLQFSLDLLMEDPLGTNVAIFLMAEPDVDTVITNAFSVIASDQYGVTSDDAYVHPRAWGAFARALRRAAQRELLDLPTAIHKMSGLPATIVGLPDRGFVRPGQIADLVLFDPSQIKDQASYEQPTRPAEGIDAVLIGGRFAIERGETADLGLGRVIRRSGQFEPAA